MKRPAAAIKRPAAAMTPDDDKTDQGDGQGDREKKDDDKTDQGDGDGGQDASGGGKWSDDDGLAEPSMAELMERMVSQAGDGELSLIHI
eukprot:8112831-Pyramimonas_sp.AAC.1